MKQSGRLNPSEEHGTGCPVTSEYGRTPPSKHGGVGRQQQQHQTWGEQTPLILNEEIASDILKYKQNLWKEHLDVHLDHRHNTHILWKTIHGLSKRTLPPTLNTSITFTNKIETTPKHIANCFTKHFTNTVKYATHKTNRSINRATHTIQRCNITITTTHVEEAIKQSKNNNSHGPDKLNIRHLKPIGPYWLAILTSMLITALNTNIIPHTWKLVNIVPIPKPNKDID